MLPGQTASITTMQMAHLLYIKATVNTPRGLLQYGLSVSPVASSMMLHNNHTGMTLTRLSQPPTLMTYIVVWDSSILNKPMEDIWSLLKWLQLMLVWGKFVLSTFTVMTVQSAAAHPGLSVTKVQLFYCGHYSIIGTCVRLYLNSIVFKADYLSTIEYIVWYVICRDGRT